MVEESISKAGRHPPVLPAANCSQESIEPLGRHKRVTVDVREELADVQV